MTAPQSIHPGHPLAVRPQHFPRSPAQALPRLRDMPPVYAVPGQPGLYPPLRPGEAPRYLSSRALNPDSLWGLDGQGRPTTTAQRPPTRSTLITRTLAVRALYAVAGLHVLLVLAVLAGPAVIVGAAALGLSLSVMGGLRRLGLTRARPRRKYPY